MDHLRLIRREDEHVSLLCLQAFCQSGNFLLRKELHDRSLPLSVLDLNPCQTLAAVAGCERRQII
ncbi:hypothetical protein D3C76_1853510 [compost metagenome]